MSKGLRAFIKPVQQEQIVDIPDSDLVWEVNKNFAFYSRSGYLGGWRVFEILKWADIPRKLSNYKLECLLPGLKRFHTFETEPEAIECAVSLLNNWFEGLSKKRKVKRRRTS